MSEPEPVEEEPKPLEEEPVLEEEPEVEVEPEAEDPVEEVSPSEPVGGWEGWKSLLLQGLGLGDDFKLPDPITTPGYVPSPPSTKCGQISTRGKTTITFSEDVFELPDLNNKTIKVPRQLQSETFEFPYDEYPFIEITVEPGYMSDPEKLKFEYDLKFTGPKTIEVSVKFLTPTYVSAN